MCNDTHKPAAYPPRLRDAFSHDLSVEDAHRLSGHDGNRQTDIFKTADASLLSYRTLHTEYIAQGARWENTTSIVSRKQGRPRALLPKDPVFCRKKQKKGEYSNAAGDTVGIAPAIIYRAVVTLTICVIAR